MTEAPKSQLKADPTNIKARQFQKRSNEQTSRCKPEQDESYDRRQEEYVRDYNDKYRQEALVDIHKRENKQGKVEETQKDLDNRIFDWERDMNSGTKAGSSKDTADVLSKFGKLDNRFSSSSTKKFL